MPYTGLPIRSRLSLLVSSLPTPMRHLTKLDEGMVPIYWIVHDILLYDLVYIYIFKHTYFHTLGQLYRFWTRPVSLSKRCIFTAPSDPMSMIQVVVKAAFTYKQRLTCCTCSVPVPRYRIFERFQRRFRIDIMNPPTQTTSNFWTMTLLDHFAKPIPSFNLWKFPEISVSTYARNSAPSCYLGDCVGAGQGIAIPILRWILDPFISSPRGLPFTGKKNHRRLQEAEIDSTYFNLKLVSQVSLPLYSANASVERHVYVEALRMQLTLRTQNTVMTGGQLVILAPLEFGFDPDPQAPLIQGDKQTRCLIMEYENLGLHDWNFKDVDWIM